MWVENYYLKKDKRVFEEYMMEAVHYHNSKKYVLEWEEFLEIMELDEEEEEQGLTPFVHYHGWLHEVLAGLVFWESRNIEELVLWIEYVKLTNVLWYILDKGMPLEDLLWYEGNFEIVKIK